MRSSSTQTLSLNPPITEISLRLNTVIRFVSDHHKDRNAESFQIHV